MTRIAHAAKRYWGYPENYIRLWKNELTLTPEFIARTPVFSARCDADIVGLCELDGLPVARVSRETILSAWNSPVLSQRAKGLVFAVVARGLDSKRSEQEARRLLAPLGLDDGDVDEILSHLASPKPDPIEAAIVPFARETIRYRPADIQRRARKLLEQLSVEQFMEFAGVVGLANGICRRSLALCEN